MLEAVRKMLKSNNNENANRSSQAKAVRISDEINPDIEGADLHVEAANPEPGFLSQSSVNGQSEGQSYGPKDHLKILKLADKKQLSLECGGHQITKELECESNHSEMHLDIYVAYLRQLGHDVDRKMLAKSLRARRSVAVGLKKKWRQAFGPVEIGVKIDFIQIVATA